MIRTELGYRLGTGIDMSPINVLSLGLSVGLSIRYILN